MMKYNPKIVISACLVFSLLFAGGLIFYIQRNGGNILGTIMIIYFVLYFNTLLALYITNTWIFEKYEHDPTPDPDFARPQGVHTIPLEPLCDYTVENGITTSVTCPSNKNDGSTVSTDPSDLASGASFLAWAQKVNIAGCPVEFLQTTPIAANTATCMNTKKQILCLNGTVMTDKTANPDGKCPTPPPSPVSKTRSNKK